MGLGGNGWCPGCQTSSSAGEGMLCSACLLRESNERIAKDQIEAMRDAKNDTQQQNIQYVYLNETQAESEARQREELIQVFVIFGGIMAFIGTLIWSASDNMTWWESVFYIFWWPLKMFFSLVIYVASLGMFNLF